MSDFHKPHINEWFINNHYYPLRRRHPDLTIRQVLELARNELPFQLPMSDVTFYRWLRRMAQGKKSTY